MTERPNSGQSDTPHKPRAVVAGGRRGGGGGVGCLCWGRETGGGGEVISISDF